MATAQQAQTLQDGQEAYLDQRLIIPPPARPLARHLFFAGTVLYSYIPGRSTPQLQFTGQLLVAGAPFFAGVTQCDPPETYARLRDGKIEEVQEKTFDIAAGDGSSLWLLLDPQETETTAIYLLIDANEEYHPAEVAPSFYWLCICSCNPETKNIYWHPLRTWLADPTSGTTVLSNI